MTKSPKERSLNRKILKRLNGNPLRLAEILLEDDEIRAMQEYGNTVSIKRLGYNDHGPVHMRVVMMNAITMMELLQQAGIQTSLQSEELGDFDDSLCAVMLASFLHDLGMGIGRQDHELHSTYLAYPIIDRILKDVYPEDLEKRIALRSLAIEGIIGHMAHHTIHSLEAGVILIADGCDMERGRARIPMFLNTSPKVGDIHKYSANSIEKVSIERGTELPVKIRVDMSTEVGFFQVEEVLLSKIAKSTVKPYIELYAGVIGGELKRYL
ncbi:phosphohydrolase [Marispirochaeta sp.]|jgi:uncharacterized protein|uniref:phosphohydrolase n=1 Tax=Marispirochaeta sp. TaxID=2038653 RepID=UPI0029C61AA3|nr:phosphohydrolase [Marispirochaeta sp.]